MTAELLITLIFLVIVLIAILYIISIWVYKRAPANMGFIRTGYLGTKVCLGRGAMVLPVFHEVTWVSLETIKLIVSRSRDQAVLTKTLQEKALSFVRSSSGILEAVLLSTCNRSEMYATTDEEHTDPRPIEAWFHEIHGLDEGVLSPYLYHRKDEAVIRHLFRVDIRGQERWHVRPGRRR